MQSGKRIASRAGRNWPARTGAADAFFDFCGLLEYNGARFFMTSKGE
jgi:hypothetical protein